MELSMKVVNATKDDLNVWLNWPQKLNTYLV